MGGLAVFFLIGLYVFVAYKVVNSTKTKWAKWLAVVIMALIPTADAVVGRVYLKHLCAIEGGLKVNRVVDGVEGFSGGSASDHWIKEYGYQFSEGYVSNGQVNRYIRVSGKIILEEHVAPKSLYRVSLRFDGEKELYSRNKYVVEIIATNEILAVNTQIGFRGGWAEHLLGRFSDAGAGTVAWCDNVPYYPEERSRAVVLNSLKP